MTPRVTRAASRRSHFIINHQQYFPLLASFMRLGVILLTCCRSRHMVDRTQTATAHQDRYVHHSPPDAQAQLASSLWW